jgi:hypothetical protein
LIPFTNCTLIAVDNQSGAGFLGNVPVGIRCCKSWHGRIGDSVHCQYYCEQPDFIHILPILSASTFLIPITLFTPGQNHEEQLVYKQPQAALVPVTQLTLFKTIPILVRLSAISLQLQHPISFKVSLEEPTRWFSGTASY